MRRRVATTTGGAAARRQRCWVPQVAVVAHTLPCSSTSAALATTAIVGRGGAPASSALPTVVRGWWRGPGSPVAPLATVHRRRGVWAGAACGLLLLVLPPGGRHAVKAAAASQAADASVTAAASSGPAVVCLYSPVTSSPAAETRFVLKQAFIQRNWEAFLVGLLYADFGLPPRRAALRWLAGGRARSSIPIIGLWLLLAAPGAAWSLVIVIVIVVVTMARTRDSTPLTAGLALFFLKPWLDFRAYQREASAMRIDGRAVRFTGELVEYMKLTLWDAFMTVVTIGVYGVMGYPELNSARYFDTHLEWATTDHDTDTKAVAAMAPNQPPTTVGHV